MIVKPRDVPILSLAQLELLEAASTLNIFSYLVEQVSELDAEKVRVAKSRINSEIALLIQSYQRQGKCSTWENMKLFFQTEFEADVNFDRIWQEIEQLMYDWDERPQVFANWVLYKNAVIESNFPKDKIPYTEQLTRRKLWKGLPRENRDKLDNFLKEDYPFTKFLNRLEHERQFLIHRYAPNIRKVEEK